MTDQIYYKIQYPLKKAINMIQNIDTEDPFVGEENLEVIQKGLEEIENFINLWENKGKENLQEIIRQLRQIQ
ncbi:MAG: DUF1643 domain-containing protein [Halanaerobiaceae bacterium]|nr:DUF1643 domain-containing protein [Halanaerobiaceae bacterium]